jgi:hypothetical protein
LAFLSDLIESCPEVQHQMVTSRGFLVIAWLLLQQQHRHQTKVASLKAAEAAKEDAQVSAAAADESGAAGDVAAAAAQAQQPVRPPVNTPDHLLSMPVLSSFLRLTKFLVTCPHTTAEPLLKQVIIDI